MVKEQTVEKIKLEYLLYDSDEASSFESALQIVSGYRTRVSNNLDTLTSLVDKNKRDAFFSRCLGRFRSDFGYFSPEIYINDNQMLILENMMLWEYRRCFDRITFFMNEDNYQYLFHLAKFTFDSYSRNYVNMEKKRRDNRRIYYYDQEQGGLDVALDNESFYVFFDSEMEEISGTKNLEFSKKWWDF